MVLVLGERRADGVIDGVDALDLLRSMREIVGLLADRRPVRDSRGVRK
jgi:hypothetical protein